MTTWVNALDALLQQRTAGVLVTVARVEGSGPREPGAKMLVTADAQFDTIGGGHLELRACETAREMLAGGAPRRLVRFPLGPGLGQCCGGVVHLAFERIDDAASYALLVRRWRERLDTWRIVALDADTPCALYDDAHACLTGTPALPARFAADVPCHVFTDSSGRRWLIDPCRAHRPHLVLFGAGHVGTALVRALADLPCHVTWVDEREELFPPAVPANVAIEATDTPEAVVDAAAPGTSFLVMTHSHALDQRLCEAILKRGEFAWFGLIGSKTKRMQFEHRLLERGIPAERLQEMTCPIGIAGITGKQPAVIAAAVCAQLLQVWEAAERLQSHPATESKQQRA